MLWLRTWRLGVKSLLLHPMRSLLTVLGIFIGVASVIWLLAIGEGISIQAQKQIEGLGADNIIVRSVKPPAEMTAGAQGVVPYGIKRSEYEKIIATIPTIESSLQIREVRRQFQYRGRMIDGRLVGCTPNYAEVTRLEMDRGRFLSTVDNRSRLNHCVISAGVAERLFPYEDPLGRRIYMVEQEDYYQVVGVVKSRLPTAAIGGSLSAQDFSSDVYIAIETMRKRIGDEVATFRSGSFEREEVELNQLTLQVDEIKNVMPTAELIRQSLPGHERMKDIAVVVPLELLEQAKTTRLMFMLLMGLIAAISLLVGGIGIMNIMLATVTERTREIGIRRALGARRGDIMRQFLVETIALSVAGGLSGIAGGLICPFAVESCRNALLLYAPEMMAELPAVFREVSPQIVPLSVPLAFGISVVVGVAFGLYPAYRAAQMDPIEALRHE